MNTIALDKFEAINQDSRADRTSARYAHIPTTRVVSVLEHHGWLPVLAGQSRTRNRALAGFQKHIIKFQNPALSLVSHGDQLAPEIVLTNSHDGLASFCLSAGLFRFVCANGLIIADSVFQACRIRHQGYTDQAVSLAIEEICESVPRVGGRVADFQAINLTRNEQGIFAEAALIARHGEEEYNSREWNFDRMLRPVRSADAAPTLWNTMNLIQEKIIKGGRYEVKTPDTRHPNYKRTGKARAVNSIPENLRINKAIWTLTEKMAALKLAA